MLWGYIHRGSFFNPNILGKNFYPWGWIYGHWTTPKGRNIYPLFLVMVPFRFLSWQLLVVQVFEIAARKSW